MIFLSTKFINATKILRQEGANKFANVLTIETWRRLKKISYLRESIAFFYYFFRGNTRKITGKNNSININILDSIPRLKNTSFWINGKDNLIVISSGVKLENTKV